jgi:hypothetical protein
VSINGIAASPTPQLVRYGRNPHLFILYDNAALLFSIVHTKWQPIRLHGAGIVRLVCEVPDYGI